MPDIILRSQWKQTKQPTMELCVAQPLGSNLMLGSKSQPRGQHDSVWKTVFFVQMLSQSVASTSTLAAPSRLPEEAQLVSCCTVLILLSKPCTIHFDGTFFFHVMLVAGWQGSCRKGCSEERRRRHSLTSRSRHSLAGQMSSWSTERCRVRPSHVPSCSYQPNLCPNLRSIRCHLVL